MKKNEKNQLDCFLRGHNRSVTFLPICDKWMKYFSSLARLLRFSGISYYCAIFYGLTSVWDIMLICRKSHLGEISFCREGHNILEDFPFIFIKGNESTMKGRSFMAKIHNCDIKVSSPSNLLQNKYTMAMLDNMKQNQKLQFRFKDPLSKFQEIWNLPRGSF